MHLVVIGVGATGSRVARQLVSTEGVKRLTVVDGDGSRAKLVTESLAGAVPVDCAPPSSWAEVGARVVVIASNSGTHLEMACAARDAGAHVVSVSDDRDEVAQLLKMDQDFERLGLSLVVGAGFSPGLSCVLALHASKELDQVDELHLARVGNGGKACERQARRALRQGGGELIDGRWVTSAPGSGRELCWFPDPIGARDCFKGGYVEPFLLQKVFPEATRISSKVASGRKDRWLARAHVPLSLEGSERPGALRVEVRGRRDGRQEIIVFGAIDRAVVGAGVVGAVAAIWAGEGRLSRTGAGGLASFVDTAPFLTELARRGVKAAVFTGSMESSGPSENFF